jgi:transposase
MSEYVGFDVSEKEPLVCNLDNTSRFRRSSSVGAYLELTPRRYASGEGDWMERISRCGDDLARSYLYDAADGLLTRSRTSSPLRS